MRTTKHCRAALHCTVTIAMLSGVALAEGNNQSLNQAATYLANTQEIISTVPTPVAQPAKPETAIATKHSLAGLRDLLKNVSAQDSVEFLNGLIMEDGHLVTPDVAPLKHSLSDKQIVAILQSLKPATQIKLNPNNLPVRIADALKDVPADIRNEFLEKLEFSDDVIASAYIGGLRAAMSEEAISDMLKQIGSSHEGLTKGNRYKQCMDYISNGKTHRSCWSVEEDNYCDSKACHS